MHPRRRGDEQLATGMPAAALASYEESLACAHDVAVVKRAYMAACNIKNVTKARRYCAALPTSDKPRFEQTCICHGIAPARDRPSGRRARVLCTRG